SYAIIGASRGIGLEYVRQLAARADATVFAVVRNKQRSTHLQAAITNMNNVHVVEGDIVDYKSMQRAAEEVASLNDGKLDYLIHNAAKTDQKTVFHGFYDYPSMDELDADLMDAFRVNTLGVVHSVTPFVPLLRAGPTKKIIVIGTGGGDPKAVLTVGIKNMVAYCATKAAAVMVATKWALELKDEGFVVVTLTPGLVDT
ncbi:short chain dehydrogenase, partial [Trametes versicolor FP-101664 SS1]|uniref:short chain dehydrogenase n=1 Tax=Trametes versicolor (strain FP-101664) TaxID=717944 RepID=UPI00046244D6